MPWNKRLQASCRQITLSSEKEPPPHQGVAPESSPCLLHTWASPRRRAAEPLCSSMRSLPCCLPRVSDPCQPLPTWSPLGRSLMRHAEASFSNPCGKGPRPTRGIDALWHPPQRPRTRDCELLPREGHALREGTPTLIRVCASINSLPFSHLGHTESSGN